MKTKINDLENQDKGKLKSLKIDFELGTGKITLKTENNFWIFGRILVLDFFTNTLDFSVHFRKLLKLHILGGQIKDIVYIKNED